MAAQTFLALSDSHGDVRALQTVLKWAKAFPAPVETAFFLGDGLGDISRAEAALGFSFNWKMVRGNNDFNFSVPDTAFFEGAGHRFFLCHGHRFSLYSGCRALIAAAGSLEADAAFFGHTHVPSCIIENNILLVNPGSIGRPRSRIGATFAIIECSEEMPPEAQFFGIDGSKIKKIVLH